MANTGFKGVDVRQTGTALVFRSFLQTSAGALVTTGTTNLYLMELQSDGTIKTYDWSNNTFGTGTVTTENQGMTYRKSNNAATDTGLWTVALSTLTGFTVGSIYLARVNNTGASPTDQVREFQFGGEQGDIAVTSGATGIAYIQSDATKWLAGTIPAVNITGVPLVDLKYTLGTISPAAAGYVGLDWGQVTNKTTTNALTGTTFATSQVVASVTGAVGSVTGAVGSVTGSVGSVTGLTTGTITTAVWQDLTASSDFTTAGSIGALIIGVNFLDGVTIETGVNMRQAISGILAASCGKSSGVDTGSPVYKGANNTTTRIAATASAGNRTAVTLTLPT